jgi:hypothetical protein
MKSIGLATGLSIVMLAASAFAAPPQLSCSIQSGNAFAS